MLSLPKFFSPGIYDDKWKLVGNLLKLRKSSKAAQWHLWSSLIDFWRSGDRCELPCKICKALSSILEDTRRCMRNLQRVLKLSWKKVRGFAVFNERLDALKIEPKLNPHQSHAPGSTYNSILVDSLVKLRTFSKVSVNCWTIAVNWKLQLIMLVIKVKLKFSKGIWIVFEI